MSGISLIYFQTKVKLNDTLLGGVVYVRSAREKSKCLSGEAGVSMIELMVALFIFSIGALAVTAMCLMSIQSNHLVNQMTQANLLAQEKMEELLAVERMVDLAAGGPESIDGNGNAGGSYTRSWQVENVPVDDTRWLTVSVDWSDTKGNHTVVLKSLTRER